MTKSPIEQVALPDAFGFEIGVELVGELVVFQFPIRGEINRDAGDYS